ECFPQMKNCISGYQRPLTSAVASLECAFYHVREDFRIHVRQACDVQTTATVLVLAQLLYEHRVLGIAGQVERKRFGARREADLADFPGLTIGVLVVVLPAADDGVAPHAWLLARGVGHQLGYGMGILALPRFLDAVEEGSDAVVV